MAQIQMYTTRWCGYCVRAKTLLQSRGLEFEEIFLDDDPAFRQRLLELTGSWTVPQILIDGRQFRAVALLLLLALGWQFLLHPTITAPTRDPELAKLSASFARHIEQDIGRHFDFEERELFPRLEAAGEGDIAGLLKEEHGAIREVAAELLPLAHAAAAGTLDGPGWDALKRGALEMVERQVAHIQKETMALLPMLDDLLDDDTDRELALLYATA